MTAPPRPAHREINGVAHDAPATARTYVFCDLSLVRGTGWLPALGRHGARVAALAVEHGGEAIAFPGDGTLIEFDRPSDAVRFAIAVRDTPEAAGLVPGGVRVAVHRLAPAAGHAGAIGATLAIARRIAEQGRCGEVVVCTHLCGAAREVSGAPLMPRGIVDGQWLYAV